MQWSFCALFLTGEMNKSLPKLKEKESCFDYERKSKKQKKKNITFWESLHEYLNCFFNRHLKKNNARFEIGKCK